MTWFTAGPGGYATHRIVAADRLVPLPDAIDYDTAAAAMLKGCTAEMLVERGARACGPVTRCWSMQRPAAQAASSSSG